MELRNFQHLRFVTFIIITSNCIKNFIRFQLNINSYMIIKKVVLSMDLWLFITIHNLIFISELNCWSLLHDTIYLSNFINDITSFNLFLFNLLVTLLSGWRLLILFICHMSVVFIMNKYSIRLLEDVINW